MFTSPLRRNLSLSMAGQRCFCSPWCSGAWHFVRSVAEEMAEKSVNGQGKVLVKLMKHGIG